MESNQAKKQNILISAETVGNNLDLLTEILLQLPVKPLVRFKCVAKQWLSLISNPNFTLSHTRHHHSKNPTPTALLLNIRNNTVFRSFDIGRPLAVLQMNRHDPTFEFEIVPLKQHTISEVPFFHYFHSFEFRIRQSCYGLLLCSARPNIERSPYIYYICNPTTKQFKRLSIPCAIPCYGYIESLVSVCMAFDPLKSNHYKVIFVWKVRKMIEFDMNSSETIEYKIDMYSSETDCCRSLDITFTPPKRMKFANAVFCNGAVHWYSKGETSIYFHVDGECLNTMPMPKLADRPEHRMVKYFRESRGHLHLIVTECLSPLQFDVLEMGPDYSGWFVRYHVNLDAVRIAFPGQTRFRLSVLDIIRAQQEEDSIVVMYVGDKAISYNFHNGTVRKLYDEDLEHPVKHTYRWRSTFQSFEILTSV